MALIEIEEKDYELPKLEFEFVDKQSDQEDSSRESNDEQQYAFPLFSFGSSVGDKEAEDNFDSNDVGHANEDTKNLQLIKISAKDDDEEYDDAVKKANQRPDSYYFSTYSEKERNQFAQSCVDGDYIIEKSQELWNTLWPQYNGPVIDLKEHNKKIEENNQRLRKQAKRKPGQKQRLNKKLAQQRIADREQKRQELKKKFRKRGGKKNKKANPLAFAGKDQKAPPLKPIVALKK